MQKLSLAASQSSSPPPCHLGVLHRRLALALGTGRCSGGCESHSHAWCTCITSSMVASTSPMADSGEAGLWLMRSWPAMRHEEEANDEKMMVCRAAGRRCVCVGGGSGSGERRQVGPKI